MTKDNEHFDRRTPSDQLNNDKTQTKKFSSPWNNKFGEDENFKNRQFSRTARNQPVKEATTLSQVILFVLIFCLVSPFALYAYIDSQKDKKPIEGKTAQQVVMDKKTTETTTTTEEKKTTSAETTESREIEETTTTVEVTTTYEPTPVTQDVEPEPQPVTQSPSTMHTVSAGESWWSISQAYGVDVYELASANGSTIEGTLLPGSQIVIP